jgi:cobalamin synthase
VIVGRRASPATGVGRWFAAGTRPAVAAFGVVTAVIAVVLLVEFAGPRILIAVIAGVAAATLVGLLVVRARGQLDGDGYGYLIESTFAAILVAAAIVR